MNMNRTPLHDWHVSHGANMAHFEGYDMPLWYPSGTKQEHLRVLTRCGVFDTSHMSVLHLMGNDIFQLLQWCLSRDLTQCVGKSRKPLTPGRCTYGVFLNEAGGVVDDVIVFQLARDDYLAVVNAGMGQHASKHMLNYIDTCENACNVLISDLTDRVGKIDIQGPLSARVMREVLDDADRVLDDMAYFSFKGSLEGIPADTGTVRLKNGTPVLLSRTGYTGEFGFELFINPEKTLGAWELLLKAGEPYGILPCGLAARDSIRGGAVLPLSHQDNGNWRFVNNPWSIALPYRGDRTGFTKDFLGAKALLGSPPSYYTYPFVGDDLRKVSVDGGTPPVVLDRDGAVIGIVLTCVTDMGIGRSGEVIYSITSPDKPDGFVPGGLRCGFVKVKVPLAPGEKITLRDGKRALPAVIATEIRPNLTARRPMAEMLAYTPTE